MTLLCMARARKNMTRSRLDIVLCRLSECGLTLKKKQCQYRLSKLAFFGHDLRTVGINASKEKIAAIEAARPPQNAREARLFMQLVHCPIFCEVYIKFGYYLGTHIGLDQEGHQSLLGARTRKCV